MNDAGTIAGNFINAFAVNEGAIVHVLSGTMTTSAGGTLTATRRAAINDTLAIRFVGSNDGHKRVAAPGVGSIVLLDAVNASQRHAAQLSAAIRFKSAVAAICRRSAPGIGTMRLLGRNDLHARRNAMAIGTIALKQKRANAVRRLRAPGSGLIRFLHLVNLRAFAPIYGKDTVRFRQSATAVRRVGLPSHSMMVFGGAAIATARRTISTASTLRFLMSIRMPHRT
ncbi:hypothetical protein ELZ19_09545 [Brucella abortus]|nr:hypothetical protein ELZ20_17350 [Brucella abortus]RUR05959.1 hypothetical protein ELZ19_09545 [Brucella abortus]